MSPMSLLAVTPLVSGACIVLSLFVTDRHLCLSRLMADKDSSLMPRSSVRWLHMISAAKTRSLSKQIGTSKGEGIAACSKALQKCSSSESPKLTNGGNAALCDMAAN